MTTLVNNQPFVILVGASEVGPMNLPQGTNKLLVTHACGTWPSIADGTLTVTLRISDDNEAHYRDVWSDTFQHVALFRRGVLQPNAQFGIQLEAPFGPTSKLKVGFQSDVLVSTTVSVDAS